MRIITFLVSFSGAVSPAFGAWMCHYGRKDKGPFKLKDALKKCVKKIKEGEYSGDNVKLSHTRHEEIGRFTYSTYKRYEKTWFQVDGDDRLFKLEDLFDAKCHASPQVRKNMDLTFYEDGETTKLQALLSANTESAASGGAAGADHLNIRLNEGNQDVRVFQFGTDHDGHSDADSESSKILNDMLLKKAIEMYGKKEIITEDADSAKYFFRGGWSDENYFNRDYDCWMEACFKDSWRRGTLSWPARFGLKRHNLTMNKKGDVAMYKFDTKRFKADGGRIIKLDDKLFDKKLGTDGGIETILQEMSRDAMGAAINRYMCAKHFKEEGNRGGNYWNRMLVIQRYNSTWDPDKTGKVDCHIFINGAAKYLEKRLEIQIVDADKEGPL